MNGLCHAGQKEMDAQLSATAQHALGQNSVHLPGFNLQWLVESDKPLNFPKDKDGDNLLVRFQKEQLRVHFRGVSQSKIKLGRAQAGSLRRR
jgi:hypothetical protein